MAAKLETTFYNGVNRHLDKAIYHMKNHNPYVSGIPDIWYSGRNDLWVEYKFIPRKPVRAPVKPQELLSALQSKWLRERYDEGRNLAVIIGCPEGGVVLTNLEWESEISVRDFETRIKSKKELALWIESQVQHP